MNASRPETVVLGNGPYSRAMAQVLGAWQIPDDWLIRRSWGAATDFEKPLIGCQHVYQVTSNAESSAWMRWRHDAFWSLYGDQGGTVRTAPGLKWLLLDCRVGGADPVAPPSAFCLRIPAEKTGLRGILAACREATVHSYHDWHDALVDDRELQIRRAILRLVCEGARTVETSAEIRKRASGIGPLAWERFCPPPDDHGLANRIRAWLRSPVTEPVRQWFMEGESLLRQTTLNP